MCFGIHWRAISCHGAGATGDPKQVSLEREEGCQQSATSSIFRNGMRIIQCAVRLAHLHGRGAHARRHGMGGSISNRKDHRLRSPFCQCVCVYVYMFLWSSDLGFSGSDALCSVQSRHIPSHLVLSCFVFLVCVYVCVCQSVSVCLRLCPSASCQSLCAPVVCY